MKRNVKMTEKQLKNVVETVINETEEKNYEKGKSGMKAARSRADYEPTPKETEIMKNLFGKYENDIPPIVVRYLRKISKKEMTKRLIELDMIDLETVMNEFDVE